MDLVTRVKNILMTPQTEWPVIAAEKWDVASLYKVYIMPLAAIPPVCVFLRLVVFGHDGFHAPFGPYLMRAIVDYLVMLGGVYLLALIFSRLAPAFDGVQDDLAGLKLATFAGTAYWLAGVFRLVPLIGWLLSLLLSLYGLYLLYTGAPVLMRIPQERAIPYTAAVIVAAIVVLFIVGIVVGLIFAGPGMI
jgi:hypothetical protein